MNRFPSTKRYSRLDEPQEGAASNPRDSWTPGPASHQAVPGSEYEMFERRPPTKRVASAFTEELPRFNQPKYAAVDTAEEYSSSKGLEEDHIGVGKVDTGYSPLFTRRWVLFSFALLWVLILVSLQILYSVSQSNKGLATTDSSLRYLWTYGPTAILVVVTVLWRQVDYAAKYVQPWGELARGPVSAEKSLLLDYITPFQIVALWRSIKYRHLTITSTVLIFVLIKALTVISTGLLNLEAIEFEDVAQSMRPLTIFNGSQGLPVEAVDSRAAVGLYGAKNFGMLLPNGTTLEYAFQLFEPAGTVPNDTYAYNASVDVFHADGWECESGKLTYKNATDHEDVGDGTGLAENTPTMFYWNTSVSLSDCQIHNGHLDAPSWYWQQNDTTPRYGYWGLFQNVNCSNLADTDPKKQRYMLSVAYSMGTGQDDNIMLNSSNTVCRPCYAVQAGYVSLFTNGTVNGNIVLSGQKRLIDGISVDDVAKAVASANSQAITPSRFDSYNFTADGFVTAMVDLTPNFKLDMVMDNNWLASASEKVFKQYAAQVAGIYIARPVSNNETIPGLLARNELRLVTKQLPTRLMQACSAVMLVLTLVMTFTMPRNVVPRSVESIAAIAVILARSPGLAQILKHTGHLEITALLQVLSRHHYMSVVADAPHGKTFSIRVVSDAEPLGPHHQHKHVSWMRPFVVRRTIMILTLLLAICVLIAVEVLYRYSNAHNGIADVNVDSLAKYAWLYSPVVVLVLLATTFNILDFELEFADPYHELSRGFTTASKSLLWDPLRHITPRTCLEAFQKSRYALVASSIAVLFAPLLTISVSGLFSARPVPNVVNTLPALQNWFNTSSCNDYDCSDSQFATPSLVLQGNMSYPQWTWNELAFPAIDLSRKSTGIANITGGSFEVGIPAVRGSLTNCTLVPQDGYTNLTVTVANSTLHTSSNVFWNISGADGCANSGNADGSKWLTSSVNIPDSGSGYFGQLVSPNSVVGFDYGVVGFGATFDSDTNMTVYCPSFGLVYGQISEFELKSWQMWRCYSGWDTIDTNATISADLATVAAEPVIDERSAKPFNESWYISAELGEGGLYFSTINRTHSDELFDPFVDVMIYGKDGLPREQLLNGSTLIEQFTHTYRQWTAQWASKHMRESTDALAKNATKTAGTLPKSITGTYHNPNRQRLFLTEVSTRILQAVIAVLLICGIIIFLLVDMSKVLPKPVGSIGAVASLLAGSSFVDERSGLIPRGSEWMSDTELKNRAIWTGQQFTMKWWPEDEKPLPDDCDSMTYSGAGGEMLEGGLEKEVGHFRIDARPRMS